MAKPSDKSDDIRTRRKRTQASITDEAPLQECSRPKQQRKVCRREPELPDRNEARRAPTLESTHISTVPPKALGGAKQKCQASTKSLSMPLKADLGEQKVRASPPSRIPDQMPRKSCIRNQRKGSSYEPQAAEVLDGPDDASENKDLLNANDGAMKSMQRESVASSCESSAAPCFGLPKRSSISVCHDDYNRGCDETSCQRSVSAILVRSGYACEVQSDVSNANNSPLVSKQTSSYLVSEHDNPVPPVQPRIEPAHAAQKSTIDSSDISQLSVCLKKNYLNIFSDPFELPQNWVDILGGDTSIVDLLWTEELEIMSDLFLKLKRVAAPLLPFKAFFPFVDPHKLRDHARRIIFERLQHQNSLSCVGGKTQSSSSLGEFASVSLSCGTLQNDAPRNSASRAPLIDCGVQCTDSATRLNSEVVEMSQWVQCHSARSSSYSCHPLQTPGVADNFRAEVNLPASRPFDTIQDTSSAHSSLTSVDNDDAMGLEENAFKSSAVPFASLKPLISAALAMGHKSEISLQHNDQTTITILISCFLSLFDRLALAISETDSTNFRIEARNFWKALFCSWIRGMLTGFGKEIRATFMGVFRSDILRRFGKVFSEYERGVGTAIGIMSNSGDLILELAKRLEEMSNNVEFRHQLTLYRFRLGLKSSALMRESGSQSDGHGLISRYFGKELLTRSDDVDVAVQSYSSQGLAVTGNAEKINLKHVFNLASMAEAEITDNNFHISMEVDLQCSAARTELDNTLIRSVIASHTETCDKLRIEPQSMGFDPCYEKPKKYQCKLHMMEFYCWKSRMNSTDEIREYKPCCWMNETNLFRLPRESGFCYPSGRNTAGSRSSIETIQMIKRWADNDGFSAIFPIPSASQPFNPRSLQGELRLSNTSICESSIFSFAEPSLENLPRWELGLDIRDTPMPCKKVV